LQSNLHTNGNSSQSLISTAINQPISSIETIDFCPCIETGECLDLDLAAPCPYSINWALFSHEIRKTQ